MQNIRGVSGARQTRRVCNNATLLSASEIGLLISTRSGAAVYLTNEVRCAWPLGNGSLKSKVRINLRLEVAFVSIRGICDAFLMEAISVNYRRNENRSRRDELAKCTECYFNLYCVSI